MTSISCDPPTLRITQPRPHDFGQPRWMRLEAEFQIEIDRILIALQIHMLSAQRRDERFDHQPGDPLFAELTLRPDIQQIRIADPIRQHPRRADDLPIAIRDAGREAVAKRFLQLLRRAPVVKVIGGQRAFQFGPIDVQVEAVGEGHS